MQFYSTQFLTPISFSSSYIQAKLIAEPWDLGLYMVGSFPNWDIWKEWNGQYRDDVRRFIRCAQYQGLCLLIVVAWSEVSLNAFVSHV